MLEKISWLLVAVIAVLALYLSFWPVPIDPLAWQAPPNPGFTGPFEANEYLSNLETFEIAGNHGPEDIALDAQGRIYAATHDGNIVRLVPEGSNPKNWVNTKGRPMRSYGTTFSPTLICLRRYANVYAAIFTRPVWGRG